MGSHAIDNAIFSSLKSLLNNDIDELVYQYLKSSTDCMNLIESGIKSGDTLQVANAAHTIKSSSRQIGAVNFAELLIQMEKTAKENNITDLENTYKTVKSAHNEVIEALETIIKENTTK